MQTNVTCPHCPYERRAGTIALAVKYRREHAKKHEKEKK